MSAPKDLASYIYDFSNEVIKRERFLADELALLVDEMAEYAEHRHHNRIEAVMNRCREARK